MIKIMLIIGLFAVSACAVSAQDEARTIESHVVFLGTGAADIYTPDQCRCETCAYIHEKGGKNKRRFSSLYAHPGLLIDFSTTGMDSLEQCGIDPDDLTSLLFTHSHGDHFNPQAVVQLVNARKAEEPLNIYGNSRVISALKEHSSPRMTLTELKPYQDFRAGEWSCTALAANHAMDEEECLIYILNRNGHTILYATDTTWFPARTFADILNRKLDTAIVEATFGHRTETEYLLTHLNFDMNRAIRELLVKREVLKPGGVYALTHLSLHMIPPHDLIHEQLEKEGILIPYDGQKLVLGAGADRP